MKPISTQTIATQQNATSFYRPSTLLKMLLSHYTFSNQKYKIIFSPLFNNAFYEKASITFKVQVRMQAQQMKKINANLRVSDE